MATADLTKTPLLNKLLSFQIEGVEVDLHNDYECQIVKFEKNTLDISFSHISSSQGIRLQFRDIVLHLLSVNLCIQHSAIDLFYRGRFEEQEGVFSTYDRQGRSYFYLNFGDGSEIRLFARDVIAELI